MLKIFPSSHYILLALLFVVSLELIAFWPNFGLGLLIGLLVLVAIGIFLIRLEERDDWDSMRLALPILSAIGIAGFAIVVPLGATRQIYFILSGLVFYWLLKFGARGAFPTWNWAVSLVVYFLNIAILMSLRSILYIPVWLTLIGVGLVSTLIAWQGLDRAIKPRVRAGMYGLAIGIVLVQAAWLLQFVSLSGLGMTAVLSVIYYASFFLLQESGERKIKLSDWIEYLILAAVAVGIILIL